MAEGSAWDQYARHVRRTTAKKAAAGRDVKQSINRAYERMYPGKWSRFKTAAANLWAKEKRVWQAAYPWMGGSTKSETSSKFPSWGAKGYDWSVFPSDAGRYAYYDSGQRTEYGDSGELSNSYTATFGNTGSGVYGDREYGGYGHGGRMAWNRTFRRLRQVGGGARAVSDIIRAGRLGYGVYTGIRGRNRNKFRPGYSRTGGYYGRFGGGGMGRELKFHDVDFSNSVVSAIGKIEQLLEIKQGTTESERIGRKCTIKTIGLRVIAKLPPVTVQANSSDTLRFMLILDKQTNGAPATPSEVLQTADILEYKNVANSTRFEIIWDKSITINAQAGAGNGTTDNDTFEMQQWLYYFKKVHIPIEYNNTLGAITEIRSNNLFLLQFSEKGLIQTRTKARIRFVG